MNKAFIKSTLQAITGQTNPMNKWLTLVGACQRVGTIKDSSISVDPLHRMFYFSDNDEMLYVLCLDGNLIPSTETKSGYMTIELNGKTYLNQISKGSISHGDFVFHHCVSFDKIVAFYYPDNNEDVLSYVLNELQ